MPDGIYQGKVIIKRWESCRLIAFKPIPTDSWTIGWGATGPGITEGLVWDQEQADADLDNRCARLASQLRPIIKWAVTDNQFGACLSLAYNIGYGAFSNSTLLKKLNAGDIAGAADQFLAWNKSAGQFLQGLLNRRKDERNLFLTP